MGGSKVRVSRDALAALLAVQRQLEEERGERPSISSVVLHLAGRHDRCAVLPAALRGGRRVQGPPEGSG